jgi:hypothetical protein
MVERLKGLKGLSGQSVGKIFFLFNLNKKPSNYGLCKQFSRIGGISVMPPIIQGDF